MHILHSSLLQKQPVYSGEVRAQTDKVMCFRIR
nr:MAG TPA: hypothetical protein [Caudoviricetes sp.]